MQKKQSGRLPGVRTETLESRRLLANTASIGGSIIKEIDNYGVRDAGETALLVSARVYVDLNANGSYDAGDRVAEATDEGRYAFNGLAAGLYRVAMLSAPIDYAQSLPANNAPIIVTLADGQAATGVDFLTSSHQPLRLASSSSTSLSVGEGTSKVITLKLNRRPWSDVLVTVVPDSDSDASVTASVTSLRFTPDDWDVPRPVTFRAAPDADDVAGKATFRFASAGLSFGTRFVVTEIDDEVVIVEPPPSGSTIHPAESAILSGGTVRSSQWGDYTGSGYADFGGDNSAIEWSVTRATTGAATLEFRYANGGATNRPLRVVVNGNTLGTVACAPTGGWATWRTVSIDAPLMAGNNVVKTIAGAATGGNVDALTVRPTGTTPPPIDEPVVLEAAAAQFTGGTVASALNGGYLGVGYADFGGTGSSVRWTITRAAGGAATLQFRYANGSTNGRPLSVAVNGTTVGAVACAPTGSWTTWRVESIAVSLKDGINTINAAAASLVGGANLDSVTIVTGATPPPPSSPVTYQAEGLQLTNGTTRQTTNGGYTGSGYADFGGVGSAVYLMIGRATAGPTTVTLRYANGGTASRPVGVAVDGVIQLPNVILASTGSWGTWKTMSFTLNFVGGSNIIAITSTTANGVNLDAVTVG
ncbi:MAG TPA: carbohydrate-binding protein [Tepidisphaeraceae bacterium]|jgi:hypothetical protein|nr:carbohydrate-binding protein [Tepidisphaeraceae bacterium]